MISLEGEIDWTLLCRYFFAQPHGPSRRLDTTDVHSAGAWPRAVVRGSCARTQGGEQDRRSCRCCGRRLRSGRADRFEARRSIAA